MYKLTFVPFRNRPKGKVFALVDQEVSTPLYYHNTANIPKSSIAVKPVILMHYLDKKVLGVAEIFSLL
jgi:hypothetical protein